MIIEQFKCNTAVHHYAFTLIITMLADLLSNDYGGPEGRGVNEVAISTYYLALRT